jgi:hypothetical protein
MSYELAKGAERKRAVLPLRFSTLSINGFSFARSAYILPSSSRLPIALPSLVMRGLSMWEMFLGLRVVVLRLGLASR